MTEYFHFNKVEYATRPFFLPFKDIVKGQKQKASLIADSNESVAVLGHVAYKPVRQANRSFLGRRRGRRSDGIRQSRLFK